ncbi:MAG: hypothetical protein NVS9B15_00320 [Acidobacteriaceae bacterium]
MEPHDLQNTLALLARFPKVLDALLRDMPEIWTRKNEGGELIVHRSLCRTLFMPSAWIGCRACIAFWSTAIPANSPRFDRDPEESERLGRTVEQLVDHFAHLRAENLERLRALNLKPSDLERRGRHPKFGSVTLSQLLATWAAHDLTHLHQISRAMAHQYRQAVGPWTAFLGVMHCNGHSEA